MEDHHTEPAPHVYARIGGVIYLIIIVLGATQELFIRGAIVVPGDAAATAANLASMEWLWRLGIAAEIVLLICAASLTPIFYYLLRPVSGAGALLVVCFNLVSLVVEATAALSLVAALAPVRGAAYLAAFSPEQLHAMARLAISAHGQGFTLALTFFGCECLILGYLIFRSGFLPRAVGVLMFLAGVSYLVNGFAWILSPAFADQLVPAILLPPFIGETSLCLWLLVKGVDVPKWRERASIVPAA